MISREEFVQRYWKKHELFDDSVIRLQLIYDGILEQEMVLVDARKWEELKQHIKKYSLCRDCETDKKIKALDTTDSLNYLEESHNLIHICMNCNVETVWLEELERIVNEGKEAEEK